MAMMSSSLSNLRESVPSPWSSIRSLPSNFPSQLHFTSAAASASVRPLVSSTRALRLRCLSALTPELKTTLDKVVTSEKVVLFMKGTKDFPQCGFSNNVVQILKSLNAPFETINILENELLRQGLKEYSSWPTFPQLYIDGEFFGGCDIVIGSENQPISQLKNATAFDNELLLRWKKHTRVESCRNCLRGHYSPDK